MFMKRAHRLIGTLIAAVAFAGAANAQNVMDAGGTGSDNTSV